jgi:transposase
MSVLVTLMPINKRRILSDSERKLIFKWREEEITQEKIAKRLGITQICIRHVLSSYSKDNCWKKYHLSGRKRKLNKEEIGDVQKLAEENRKLSAPRIARIINDRFMKQISPKTVKRYINLVGLKACVLKKVSLISEKNKKLRLKFAKKYILKPKSFWEKDNLVR